MKTRKIIDLSSYTKTHQGGAPSPKRTLSIPKAGPPIMADVVKLAPRRAEPIEVKATAKAVDLSDYKARIASGDYRPDPRAIAQSIMDKLFDDAEPASIDCNGWNK